jgi:hypothetical protein
LRPPLFAGREAVKSEASASGGLRPARTQKLDTAQRPVYRDAATALPGKASPWRSWPKALSPLPWQIPVCHDYSDLSPGPRRPLERLLCAPVPPPFARETAHSGHRRPQGRARLGELQGFRTSTSATSITSCLTDSKVLVEIPAAIVVGRLDHGDHRSVGRQSELAVGLAQLRP